MPWEDVIVLEGWWAEPPGRALVTLVVAVVLSVIVDRVVLAVAKALASRTAWTGDDVVVDAVHRPVAWTVMLAGMWLAVRPMDLHPDFRSFAIALLLTAAVLLWTIGIVRIGRAVLAHLARAHKRYDLVQPRTMPLFDIGFKTVVIGGSAYLVLLAWGIDVTGWLASAGIVGIAVGFAAKDSLANLFAGLFILADAPYKLGDYLVLDDSTRGRVTEIGLRSTRMLTRDDIEVILPNSLMAGAKIINESGGPYEKERVRCSLQVAYGSDLHHVRRVLEELAVNFEHFVLDDPDHKPRVRFRGFGDSGIDVQVLGWILKPELRGRALDALVVEIHDRLGAEGIEIPFPKRDVYLHRIDD